MEMMAETSVASHSACASARRQALCSFASPRQGADEAAEPRSLDSLALAQLLTSRMCHDLSGAIGVTAAADDIIGPGPELDLEAISLVADAGRRAAARLAFFRAAFGFDRASGGISIAEVRALVEPALDRPRLHFAWNEAEDTATALTSRELPAAAGRLVLCLALLASEALPRGGTIRVTTSGFPRNGLWIEAEGVGARVLPQVVQALQAPDGGDVTSSTVVAYYIRMRAAELGLRIGADLDEGRVRLSVVATGSGAFPCH